MKIKTKKEMNLPQLIEWGFKNDVTNTWYRASNVEEYISEVFFDATGLPQFSNTVNKNDTFTVEVEEEITESIVFDKLISRYVFLSSKPSYAHAINVSIKEIIEDRKKATHIYFENEDNELQLIWKNGKLVE